MTTVRITSQQVWRDHKNPLERFILSKVKRQEETEDILQEVFVKVHSNLHLLKDESRLTSWVFTIARNEIHNYFRKQRSHRTNQAFWMEEDEKNADNASIAACIVPFIDKLPQKYRTAIVLADLKKLHQQHIAEKLSISYTGAKSRVQRARKLLHKYLTACCKIVSDRYGNIISQEPKGKCACAE
jgi:RNA polymerase sigma-70 factor, ECF subfamily